MTCFRATVRWLARFPLVHGQWADADARWVIATLAHRAAMGFVKITPEGAARLARVPLKGNEGSMFDLLCMALDRKKRGVQHYEIPDKMRKWYKIGRTVTTRSMTRSAAQAETERKQFTQQAASFPATTTVASNMPLPKAS